MDFIAPHAREKHHVVFARQANHRGPRCLSSGLDILGLDTLDPALASAHYQTTVIQQDANADDPFSLAQPQLRETRRPGQATYRPPPGPSPIGDQHYRIFWLGLQLHPMGLDRPAGGSRLYAVSEAADIVALHTLGGHDHHLRLFGHGQLCLGHDAASRPLLGQDHRFARRGELLFDRLRLFDHHLQPALFRPQQSLEVFDAGLEFLLLIGQPASLQSRQSPQLHGQDRLGLELTELEHFDEVLFRRLAGTAATDGGNNLVNYVQRLQQPLDDVQPGLPLFQLVAAAADDDVQPMLEKVNQHVAQREPLRAHDGVAIGLFRDQRQSVDAEGLAQLAVAQDAL